MGQITIKVEGSFDVLNGTETFSAQESGHAIGKAVMWLLQLLKPATRMDHRLHAEHLLPDDRYHIRPSP